MFRPACNRAASQLRRVFAAPGSATMRNFWHRPWHYPCNPVDRHVDRMVREMDRMDRLFNSLWFRHAPPRVAPSFFAKEIPVEVSGDGGGRNFGLKVDVSQFAPEEVKVTVRNGTLTVRAVHAEEAEDGGNLYREYFREYSLPDGADEGTIRCILGKDGQLTVEAKLPATDAPKETEIPVEKPAEETAKN